MQQGLHLISGSSRVRIPPVPLYGTVAQWTEHRSLHSSSLHCGGGSTAESRGATSRIRVRFPATALVECRRDFDRSSRGECRGDYIHPVWWCLRAPVFTSLVAAFFCAALLGGRRAP